MQTIHISEISDEALAQYHESAYSKFYDAKSKDERGYWACILEGIRIEENARETIRRAAVELPGGKATK